MVLPIVLSSNGMALRGHDQREWPRASAGPPQRVVLLIVLIRKVMPCGPSDQRERPAGLSSTTHKRVVLLIGRVGKVNDNDRDLLSSTAVRWYYLEDAVVVRCRSSS